MLVHEVMSTDLVMAKKTDTVRFVRRDEDDELSFRSLRGRSAHWDGAVALGLAAAFKGIGVSFPQAKNKCYLEVWL